MTYITKKKFLKYESIFVDNFLHRNRVCISILWRNLIRYCKHI